MMDYSFEKWIPSDNVDSVYDMRTIGWEEKEFVLLLVPDNFNHEQRSNCKLMLIWSDVLSYQVTDERYRPDCWISDPNEAWTFYMSKSSSFLNNFKKDNDLVPEKVIHFVVRGTNFIVDLLSTEYPEVQYVKYNYKSRKLHIMSTIPHKKLASKT